MSSADGASAELLRIQCVCSSIRVRRRAHTHIRACQKPAALQASPRHTQPERSGAGAASRAGAASCRPAARLPSAEARTLAENAQCLGGRQHIKQCSKRLCPPSVKRERSSQLPTGFSRARPTLAVELVPVRPRRSDMTPEVVTLALPPITLQQWRKRQQGGLVVAVLALALAALPNTRKSSQQAPQAAADKSNLLA